MSEKTGLEYNPGSKDQALVQGTIMSNFVEIKEEKICLVLSNTLGDVKVKF